MSFEKRQKFSERFIDQVLIPSYRRLTIFALAVLLIPTGVTAHEWAKDGSSIGAAPELVDVGDEPPIDVARSIVDGAKIWPVNEPINVCFFSGSSTKHDFVAETASIWASIAPGLEFDFGPEGNRRVCSDELTDVRVSFERRGNWSYVGRDATLVDASGATLNLEVLSGAFTTGAKRRAFGTVLHEFGHALALEHEHQHPEAECARYLNWPVIYQLLGAEPNNWDKEKVDFNIGAIAPGKLFTRYDRNSIMHYNMPNSWFVEGAPETCRFERATHLSAGDKNTVSKLYPSTQGQQNKYLSELKIKMLNIGSEIPASYKSTIEDSFNSALPAQYKRNFGPLKFPVTKIGVDSVGRTLELDASRCGETQNVDVDATVGKVTGDAKLNLSVRDTCD